jgi:hypothetical protein
MKVELLLIIVAVASRVVHLLSDGHGGRECVLGSLHRISIRTFIRTISFLVTVVTLHLGDITLRPRSLDVGERDPLGVVKNPSAWFLLLIVYDLIVCFRDSFRIQISSFVKSFCRSSVNLMYRDLSQHDLIATARYLSLAVAAAATVSLSVARSEETPFSLSALLMVPGSYPISPPHSVITETRV